MRRQRVTHLRGRLIAAGRVLLGRTRHNGSKPVGGAVGQRGNRLPHHRQHHLHGIVQIGVGLPARQHLPDDHAVGVDVCASIGVPRALNLLGAREVRRAHKVAHLRQPARGLDLGDAEVHQPRLNARLRLLQEDVRRLDVAMHKALLMRSRQCIQHLHADGDNLRQRQHAQRCKLPLQIAALHEVHDQRGNLILLEDIGHPHNVGVAELILNLPLAPEPLPHIGVASQLGVQHLQHHRRAKVVARLIHQPHPTFAQLPDDGVAAVCISRVQHRAQPRPKATVSDGATIPLPPPAVT